MLTGQDTARATVASSQCLTSSTGGQLFYAVRIPPGQYATVRATAQSGTTASPVLRALDGCAATSCAASTTGTSTAGATLYLPNYGAAPRDVVVSLGTTSRTSNGTYTMAATLAGATPGQFCERPVPLADGATTMGDTSNGVVSPVVCGTAGGGQVYYRVALPAGRRVTVTATPMTSTAALRLRALASCAATSCAASSLTAAAGAMATLTLSNATLVDREVVVSVATSVATASTLFTLSASSEALTPAPMSPYVAEPIAAACEDLTSGAPVAPAAGWSDQSVTGVLALPFPMRYFGATVSHYAVSSNGNLQLFPSEMATPSSGSANGSLPSTIAPNGTVAVFWDDLEPDPAGGVRTAVSGGGSMRRFVVEWDGWRPFLETTATRLRFQAKLFEGTGVVEFHYCPTSTTATERALGNSATLGLEDPTGMSAALVSLDWPGTTRPGTGWKFTPR